MTTNDFDPTTNRVQFGLLSVGEQTALRHWPHGWEYHILYDEFKWVDEWTSCTPSWETYTVYRGKPKPVVTSEWFNVYPQGVSPATHYTRRKADASADIVPRIAVLRIDTCNGVSTAHLEQLVATKEEV